jgi:hypothetical protein
MWRSSIRADGSIIAQKYELGTNKVLVWEAPKTNSSPSMSIEAQIHGDPHAQCCEAVELEAPALARLSCAYFIGRSFPAIPDPFPTGISQCELDGLLL